MRLIPVPPPEHDLLSPGNRKIADRMWEMIHLFAYGLVAISGLAVLAVVGLIFTKV